MAISMRDRSPAAPRKSVEDILREENVALQVAIGKLADKYNDLLNQLAERDKLLLQIADLGTLIGAKVEKGLNHEP